jgi:thioredoxin-like negative regulator of GroEL
MKQIINNHELKQQLNAVNGLLLLNVWANWSLQCHTMYNVMQRVSPELESGDAIAFIDWQHHRKLAKQLRVYGVPTLIVFAEAREVERFSGVTSEEVLQQYIMTEKKVVLPNKVQAISNTTRGKD